MQRNREGGEDPGAQNERRLARERREAKMFNYAEGDSDLVKAGELFHVVRKSVRSNWLRCIYTGKRIMAQGAMLFGNGLKLITQEVIDSELGGKEGFLRIFQRFYERAMDDPLLGVLFNESKVSA